MTPLLFGTAGTPVSARKRSSISGLERISELGLGCMEIEFVRGVKMGEASAGEVKKVSEKLGIALSVHAPYYINLNSADKEKYSASVERIKHSARIGSICGARSIVFHPAFYMKSSKKAVYVRVRDTLIEIQKELKNQGIHVFLRPETTGKRTQFGSLEEILNLSSEVDGVFPCIDFSHLHARTGRSNTKEEFKDILKRIEDSLGTTALQDMHIHISGIEYGRKGELNHLNFHESDLRYHELLEVFKDFNIGGLVICESPSLEGDALLLKKAFLGFG